MAKSRSARGRCGEEGERRCQGVGQADLGGRGELGWEPECDAGADVSARGAHEDEGEDLAVKKARREGAVVP